MVTDEVGLYNLALNATGARSNLSSVNDRDRGAEVCRLWYPIIRDQVLQAAPWPSCKAFKRLAVLQNRSDDPWVEGDPEPGYAIAYSTPSDMIQPRYLSDFSKFTMSSYPGNKRAINSNTSAAVLVYTSRNYNIANWESQLQMAIAYGLAANICMPLSGKPQRASLLIGQANDLITTAKVAAANSESTSYETLPDWIAARGYNNPSDTRYYFPTGSLLVLSVPA